MRVGLVEVVMVGELKVRFLVEGCKGLVRVIKDLSFLIMCGLV